MVVKLMRWSPDVCSCKVNLQWDTDTPQEIPIGVGIEKSCPEHSGLTDPIDFHLALVSESQRLNITRQDLLDNFPDMGEVNSEGDFTFKNGVTVNWSFTGQDARVLHITVTGYTLTQGQKDTITAIADAKFGIGEVVFD